MQKNIPFFESHNDTHCFQACLKMALSFWLPRKDYSLKYLNDISGHQEDKWTWQGAALLYLTQHGFEIVNIENLDYKFFAERGEKYLKSIWDEETYQAQSNFSDLEKEQEVAKQLVKNQDIKLVYKEDINIKDVEELFEKNYTVLVSVNPYTLRGEEGYSSHMVVITDISREFVIFHDPGPPGKRDKKITIDIFNRAMSRPAKKDGNVIGIKRKDNL